MTATGLPCTDSGRKGTGGAVVRTSAVLSSSGIDEVRSRHPVTTCLAASPGKNSSPPRHRGTDRVQRELHRGDHTEVAAAAAQRPEQVGVLLGAGVHQPAVGGDDIRGDQTVAGQAVAAQQPADATAEGEPADPGGGDQPAGDRQAEGLGFVVEVGPGGTALRDGTATSRVDGDRRHG